MVWQRHIPWKAILAVTVLAGLAARLAWVASHTETGWETIAADWHAATIGRIVGYRLPVAQRHAMEQDSFWLSEIDRVLARERKTPELFQGAIRILDTYNGDYQQIPSPEFVSVPEIDVLYGESHRNPNSEFVQKRRAKQMALAEEACSEFPSSPSVWQIRAEENQPFDAASQSTADEWTKLYDGCATHDPGNSLYPFLAASRLLSEATRIAVDDDIAANNGNPRSDDVIQQHQQLEIESENSAIKLIDQALELPRFELAHDRQPVLAFIDKTSLPKREKAHLGAWFDVPNYLLTSIVAELQDLIGRVEARTAGADTEKLRRTALAVCELFSKQPPKDALWRWYNVRFRAGQWKAWLDYLGRDLTRPESDEFRQVRQKAIDLEVDSRRWLSAVQRWAGQSPPPFRNTWLGFVAWNSAGLTVLLILIAGITYLVWCVLRVLGPKAPPVETVRLGLMRQLTAWTVAALATISLLGLAPAEIISHAVQSWIVLGLFLAVMIAIPVVTAIALGGQISLRTLLALVFVYAFVFGALFYWDAIDVDRPLRKFPPELWIPARGVPRASAAALQGMLSGNVRTYPPSPLRWPALQWVFYHGAEWTVGLALVAVGLWWLARANRKWKQSDDSNQRSSRRNLWLTAGVLRAIAGSAAWAAVVALAAYLALAPQRIEPIEALYQFERVQALRPEDAFADIQKNYDELAADKQNTQALRQQVEHDFSQPPDTQ